MESNSDDIHKLTETVYKNLENFNTGLRKIILTGKAYYKVLQAMSTTAQAYNEALHEVGSVANVCHGGTEALGEFILQIAQAQQEIQARIDDSTKALFTELILPLEQKLEKDFQKAHLDARKYSHGHKGLLSPVNRATESLKKYRKKTSKHSYDNGKEAQYVKSLEKCQEKLHEYRIQGFRSALLEEHLCHCFLLQRLCAVSDLNVGGHACAQELYKRLAIWKQACSNSLVLPTSVEQLSAEFRVESYAPVVDGTNFKGIGEFTETRSLGNHFGRSQSIHDIYRDVSFNFESNTLPHRKAQAYKNNDEHVQAVYSFTSKVDNQLSFNEGDVIRLIGEKSEGWQYGQDIKNLKQGWFPLSFTQPIETGGINTDFQLSARQRVRSFGDMLDSKSEKSPLYFEQNIHRFNPMYGEAQQGDLVPQVSSTESPQCDLVHQSIEIPAMARLPSIISLGSPVRQQYSEPAPAIPNKLVNRRSEDLGAEEPEHSPVNPFASVSLRKIKSNDRSAPMI